MPKLSKNDVKQALHAIRLEAKKKREERALRVLLCYMCAEQAEAILEHLIKERIV